jgi:hypothetical protein
MRFLVVLQCGDFKAIATRGKVGRVLFYDVWHPVWFALLNFTRPLRRSLRD